MWRADDIGDVELLHAKYVTYSFARHTHEGVAIGIIENGAERFWYQGATHRAQTGDVIVFNPGEVHTGESADPRGWTFRIFYMDSKLLQYAASESAGRRVEIPFFRACIIQDHRTAKLLHSLHRSLTASASTLERQSKFLWIFAQFVQKYADDRPFERPVGCERAAVVKIREYLEDRYDSNVSLDELARLVSLSSYSLLRAFRQTVGLPPHAYLNQVRVNRAKRMLQTGSSLADAAIATGFVDQSHFSKHFKKLVGVPPGLYQAGARTYKTP